MHSEDTICAISSPAGTGAIALIRISGSKAIAVCNEAVSFHEKQLADIPSNTVHLGRFIINNEPVDEVMISVFRAPHTYTGEDIIEISCHGSKYIQQKILETIIEKGARLAKPGEFTQRAFLNGKMDLSQAEAVADLIASQSAGAHRLAINQMRGGFSDEIRSLRDKLLHFVSLMELELDFSEEDVEFADRKELEILISSIRALVERLIRSFDYGNAMKHGIPVAIAGQTNSGKSTLLNLLLHEEKAIVSEIAGTTRDYIEDVIILKGIQFRFIDTAGLRHTTDNIESEGIRRTLKKIEQARVVLVVIDLNENPEEVEKGLSFIFDEKDKQKEFIIVLNKKDIIAEDILKNRLKTYKNLWGKKAILQPISAKTGEGVDKLEDLLVSGLGNNPSGDLVVTNVRHLEALNHSSAALERAQNGLKNGIPADLISQDIREVLHYLGEITGEITNDEILGNIFKNFCIGK